MEGGAGVSVVKGDCWREVLILKEFVGGSDVNGDCWRWWLPWKCVVCGKVCAGMV